MTPSRLAALCLGAGSILLASHGAQAQPASDRVLRIAPHADLKTLDPVSASIVITRMHGLMIYETLFAWDANLQPKPQMVESFSTFVAEIARPRSTAVALRRFVESL